MKGIKQDTYPANFLILGKMWSNPSLSLSLPPQFATWHICLLLYVAKDIKTRIMWKEKLNEKHKLNDSL
jgi:hypothetical protein